MDRAMRQADLAKAVGISASYLNLIEHDRRRIAGQLLTDIAQALDADPAHLAHGTDRAVLDHLRHAASLSQTPAELDRTEEMAARYPGWAALIAAQLDRMTALEARVDALRDRMTHDPALAAALHDVISSVTSIRSTASILTSEETLDADWLRRFHNNIHTDAVKLAEVSEALIRFLENPGDKEGHPQPHEEVSLWLAQRGFQLLALDEGADPDAFVAQAELSKAGRGILADYVASYVADAAALPLMPFSEAAMALDHDPSALSARFGCGLDVVLRRLATLPADAGHPVFGLATCDAAGGIGVMKPVPGLILPRGGIACTLWPLFTALSQPGRPIRTEVEMAGTPPSRMLCYAQATQVAAGFDAPPIVRSVMLVIPDTPEGSGPSLKVGSHCRICPRTSCPGRREPRVTSDVEGTL